jgi:hypothetical protein
MTATAVAGERGAGIGGTTQGCGIVNAGSLALDSSAVLGKRHRSAGAGLIANWESLAPSEFLGWGNKPRPHRPPGGSASRDVGPGKSA